MRLLLDSHVLVWWLAGDEAVSPDARAAIGDPANEVFVSAASSWQIATKHRLGQMPQAAFLTGDAAAVIADQGFTELPISLRHAQIAGSLPPLHPDPFLRALVAQAIVSDLVVVSDQPAFDTYGVTRMW
ncbi:MAG TPA: type II toxin-antitoxin system VapC family toxin [Stellaceae bacterium]|jgi:PIN domain nuclease of toxin-antitoxin system|nr:type II toxin-antitoxin system VapC family toxin [Stellaceae bacterium]